MLCMTNAMCLYLISSVQSAQAEQVSTDTATLIHRIVVVVTAILGLFQIQFLNVNFTNSNYMFVLHSST